MFFFLFPQLSKRMQSLPCVENELSFNLNFFNPLQKTHFQTLRSLRTTNLNISLPEICLERRKQALTSRYFFISIKKKYILKHYNIKESILPYVEFANARTVANKDTFLKYILKSSKQKGPTSL